MSTTATITRTEPVRHATRSAIGDRSVHVAPNDFDVNGHDVIWGDTGYWTGVTITRGLDGCDYVSRDDRGGRLRIDRAAARSRTTVVFRTGLTRAPEPVATFGDSPRAYPEVTDLGWFVHPDRETTWRVTGTTVVDLYTELAFEFL